MKNISDIIDVNKRGNNGSIKCDNDHIAMTIHTQKDSTKTICVVVGRNIMKSMRWVSGDRVTVDFDCERSRILIRRVLASDKDVASWMLSARNGTHGKRRHGQTCRTCFSLAASEMTLKAFGVEDLDDAYVPNLVTITTDGVLVPLRKPWRD